MNILGAIQNIISAKNHIVVVGWCYEKGQGNNLPVDSFNIIDEKGEEVAIQSIKKSYRKNILTEFPVGFHINISNEYTVNDFLSGKVTLYVNDKKEIIPLGKAFVTRNELENSINKALSENNPNVLKSAIKGSKDLKKRLEKLLSFYFDAETEVDAKELTQITVPIGTPAVANDALIGKEGNLFLTGSAQNDNIYKIPFHGLKSWKNILNQRVSELSKREISYLHFIVPEKQTVIPQYFPVPIKTPTEAYKKLNNFLSSKNYSGLYIDIVTLLQNVENIRPTYSKVDTHNSCWGIETIFCNILSVLNLPKPYLPNTYIPKNVYGDLSRRFINGTIYSEELFADETGWDFARKKIELVTIINPESGNRGKYRVWKNANPVSQKKVIAFAGSTFALGENILQLSWWCARYFSEFHFVWDTNFDYNYIDKHKPDIVIGQSRERYLNRAPKS